MRITISRDGGRTWDRTSSREAWIPHGSEEDSYDRMVLWCSPPVRVGDEDWFYTGVVNGNHLTTRSDADQGPATTTGCKKCANRAPSPEARPLCQPEHGQPDPRRFDHAALRRRAAIPCI